MLPILGDFCSSLPVFESSPEMGEPHALVEYKDDGRRDIVPISYVQGLSPNTVNFEKNKEYLVKWRDYDEMSEEASETDEDDFYKAKLLYLASNYDAVKKYREDLSSRNKRIPKPKTLSFVSDSHPSCKPKSQDNLSKDRAEVCWPRLAILR